MTTTDARLLAAQEALRDVTDALANAIAGKAVRNCDEIIMRANNTITALTAPVEAAPLAGNDLLLKAVRALYFAAHWTADRPVDAIKLWTDVRDAAGIEPGNSPAAHPVGAMGEEAEKWALGLRIGAATMRGEAAEFGPCGTVYPTALEDAAAFIEAQAAEIADLRRQLAKADKAAIQVAKGPSRQEARDEGYREGEAAGYQPTGGAFQNPLGALRSLGLIDYPASGQVVALPILFIE